MLQGLIFDSPLIVVLLLRAKETTAAFLSLSLRAEGDINRSIHLSEQSEVDE